MDHTIGAKKVTIDGNQAAAYTAHKTNEACLIFPITPSSPMGEWADQWSADGVQNIWGCIPEVVEMQSEGGAAGALHGALQTGVLATTFTASQGLLLMIPNMYKIAGELTPTVFHVSARSLACQALSIFGDHSDVMAVRQTGFGLLAANSVQEAMDFPLIAQAAALQSRIPYLHFFDGFRTSHEIMKVEELPDKVMRVMIDDRWVRSHRRRALSPDHPVIRGTAQNPDVYFQGRETVNPFYEAAPEIMQEQMDRFAQLTGRQYRLFDYFGAPEARRVVVLMGSGAETAHETVEHLINQGEKVGVIKVRLYRPFSRLHFISALPDTVEKIAVLDRTKEPGSLGEPLYQDVVTAIEEAYQQGEAPFARRPNIIGGRYGLSSKEFTPAMVKAVLDELHKTSPKNHFTLGIIDDVSRTSLDDDPSFITEDEATYGALFYGLGSDGTVGANKNTIKIIGENTDHYVQGYFVYDSKKSGGVTVSHLRFGPKPIHSTYQLTRAQFVGCHQFVFLEKYDVLTTAAPGAVFLLNSPYPADEVWNYLPNRVQKQIIEKQLNFYVIDAYKAARETGMGARINTIMQTAFFALSEIIPKEEAIAKIKAAIQKTYGAKGEEIVNMNYAAVDKAVANLHRVDYAALACSGKALPPVVSPQAPEFVQAVLAQIIAGQGDRLPVGQMPCDGTFPTGTAKWEKRNIASEIPVWDENLCIQCAKCALVCPHTAIRIKAYDPGHLQNAPAHFKSAKGRGRDFEGLFVTVQTAPEDCTGCGLCVSVCPVKDKQEPSRKAINMAPQPLLRERERENFQFFLALPERDRRMLNLHTVKGSQQVTPLFEFSGACPGCGETPYIQLLSQLFGDRALIANATGCSSIYGGNLPTTPWTVDQHGRGPAWSNSLFEDNAEFGLGFRVSLDRLRHMAEQWLKRLENQLGTAFVDEILNADQSNETGLQQQRDRIAALKSHLKDDSSEDAVNLSVIADYLVEKSVWIVGGDGWAYDIGYGGLDHVLASGRNVNVLVLDTEVYSNTGGQMSKATPLGAVAKFAASGKAQPKKDLGLMAMAYGSVYVARIAMGASDTQTLKAFLEAEAFPGPSLIMAYSHCIAHGIAMKNGMDTHKAAVECGHWPLFRYNPALAHEGKNPLILDSRSPKRSYKDYAYQQTRFRMLANTHPDIAETLIDRAQHETNKRWALYEQLSVDMRGTNGSSPS